MTRINLADLEAVVRRINRTVNGTDETPEWFRDDDGLHQSPDVYTLSGAYGGYALHRNCSVGADGHSHGVSDVLGTGHCPKRELYEQMHGFLRGIEAVDTTR